MSTYLYELPTTGAISFADFCTDKSSGKRHATHISDATQARANVRSELKDNKRSDRVEKDFLKLVKVLDEYLPQLCGIMGCVSEGAITLTSEPTFSWRTTLSANLFNTSPRLSLPSLHADLASSLLTYAAALSNLARSTVASVGWYEHERATSDIERRTKDEKLDFAVKLLCRASGVFSYIGETVLSEWRNDALDSPGRAANGARPPDLNRDVNIGLSQMALADAQTLAIRKLLSKSAYDTALNPGPPLPSSHPSPVLVAKLHLECASLYSSALSLVQIPGKSARGKGKDGLSSSSSSITHTEGGVSADLKRYLSDESAFHAALAKKWLGVGAGESGGSRCGDAVGFLTWSKKELEELKDGGKGLALGKEKEVKHRRKERVHEGLDSVVTFLRHYKKINDTLTFQPVPAQSDLQATIPAGRLAVAAKPFALPIPAFGPGSVEHSRRQVENLEVVEGSPAPGSGAARTEGTYAGAGAYF